MWKFAVVPHEGTWIEITLHYSDDTQPLWVVPHEGTWIEIVAYLQASTKWLSFPTRERGLKWVRYELNPVYPGRSPRGNVDWNRTPVNQCFHLRKSFPTRERGLKSRCVAAIMTITASFPTRERGLKFVCHLINIQSYPSFPTRERGLKCLWYL